MSEENKTPIEPLDYIEELGQLREWLRFYLRKEFLEELVAVADLIDKSYVDSYIGIKERSEHGKNCGYAVKAKELFMALGEKPLSAKITHIYKTFLEEK